MPVGVQGLDGGDLTQSEAGGSVAGGAAGDGFGSEAGEERYLSALLLACAMLRGIPTCIVADR